VKSAFFIPDYGVPVHLTGIILILIYLLKGQNHGEEVMYDALFAVFMVVALGLIVGSGAGLLISYIAGKRAPDWAAMTRENKIFTVLLIIAFTAITIAVLSWRFLLS
jgi:hypothetical protein